MMHRKVLAFALFAAHLATAASLRAQITPPGLFCIEGDGTQIRIQWTPPAAPCGPVLGYEVHYASQPDGPYQSFTINDLGITDTVFAAGEPVYCYMTSLMDCPGQVAVSSDTLIWDLGPPVIRTVSVNLSGQIEVSWNPSASPDISDYLVYVDGANIPDTVPANAGNLYTDLVSDPQTAVHRYRLAWFRSCTDGDGRRGSIGPEYVSILAENLRQDQCNRTFNFTWTAYQTHGVQLLGYEVEVSVNGGPYQAADTTSPDVRIFTFADAQTGDFYCLRANALLGNGLKASSNAVCDTARVVDVPRGGQIRNATVINDNNIDIEYYPDSAGVVDLFRAQRSETGNNFQDWPVTLRGTSGLPEFETWRDGNATPQSRAYSYRFNREDECGNSYLTDTVRTVRLRARLGLGLSGQLSWTPYENSNATVTRYLITRIVNGDTAQLATTGAFETEYEDLNALDPTALDTVCYFVTAEAALDIPGIVQTTVFSRSNTVCLNPQPRIIAPTAFAPEGFNQVFLPIIQFGTNRDYTLRIWDRYGRELFSSNDANLGWDGSYKGVIVPIDNYVWQVIFTGQDGNTYSKAGNVIVVR